MAVIKKITIGFVVQEFDTEKRRFFCQEFVASEDHTWEDQMGNPLTRNNEDLALIYGKGGVDEPYLNMEMVQPKTQAGVVMDATPLLAKSTSFEVGERVVVMPSTDPSQLDCDEFMGVVVEIKGNLVTVKDQNNDCFDVDPTQVHHVM